MLNGHYPRQVADIHSSGFLGLLSWGLQQYRHSRGNNGLDNTKIMDKHNGNRCIDEHSYQGEF